MKIILPQGVYSPTPDQRRDISDRVLTRGTGKRPSPPRDVFFQPGSRGGTLTWKLPVVNFDVAGYRIYKETENNLYEEIKDRGRRQEYIELSAAAGTPLTITAIARLSNIVTVTVANTYRQGDSVVVAGVTGGTTSFNGTFTVKSRTSASYTFAQTGADEAGGVAGTPTSSAPPITNIFVSCIGAGGLNPESQKIQAQIQSIAEASAPTVPGVPPGYTSEGAGGGDRRVYGCVEEGTPVEFYPDSEVTEQRVECSEWIELEVPGASRPLAIDPETLVSVFKKASDLEPGDLIEMINGNVFACGPLKWIRRPSFKIKRLVKPWGTYFARKVRLHNMKGYDL